MNLVRADTASGTDDAPANNDHAFGASHGPVVEALRAVGVG